MHRPGDLWPVAAATAVSSSFLTLIDRFDGRVTVPLQEHKARHLRKGGYYEHLGRMYRIAAIRRPVDWFDTEVELVLHGADYKPVSIWPQKIDWLEDTLMVKLHTGDYGSA